MHVFQQSSTQEGLRLQMAPAYWYWSWAPPQLMLPNLIALPSRSLRKVQSLTVPRLSTEVGEVVSRCPPSLDPTRASLHRSLHKARQFLSILISLNSRSFTYSARWCQSQWEFHGGFYSIKYHQFWWHGKMREEWSFIGHEKSFITIKYIWHNYLVFSLDNCD